LWLWLGTTMAEQTAGRIRLRLAGGSFLASRSEGPAFRTFKSQGTDALGPATGSSGGLQGAPTVKTESTGSRQIDRSERTLVIHVEVSDTIRASPVKVAGMFRDYQTWPRLFSATIRGVRLVREDHGIEVLEIDHVEGEVINKLRVVSSGLIEWRSTRSTSKGILRIASSR
jgi:hypothetical protein